MTESSFPVPLRRVMGPLTEAEAASLEYVYAANARWMAEDPGSCTPLWVDLEYAREAIAAVRAGEACPCLLESRECRPCIDGSYEGDRAAYAGW